MSLPKQKTIEEYLENAEITAQKKEKVILAITDILYQRNQNVIKIENEKDDVKKWQFLRSVKEYDEIINGQISQIIDGRSIDHTYEF